MLFEVKKIFFIKVKRASLLLTLGQSSLVLAPHFSKVVGLDVSKTQVEEAKQQLVQQSNFIKNVDFRFQRGNLLSNIVEHFAN